MNLTINEQLMIDTKDAHVCIFIANLTTWLRYNATKKDPKDRNFHDGKYWSYNSIEDFVKFFGFWSTQNIRTIIKNCIAHELIITNTFNKKKYDNTVWYTLTDKGLEYFPQLREILLNTLVDSNKTLVETNNAIPEELNSLSNINITISDIVEIYHEELPELPKVRKVDTSMKGQLKKMIKDWPSYQKDGEAFTLDSFRNYLILLKKHYSWFLKPYTTESGNTVKSSLRKLTRELNITRIVNGEFSAN